MRILIVTLLLGAGFTIARAQDTPERQQTNPGGTVVVIEDGGKPQNSNSTKSENPQTTKPETVTEAVPATQNTGQVAKTDATQGSEEGKAEEKSEELQPELPRVRKVYKKDTTRRVVLRRRTKGSAGQAITRELREGYRIQIFTGGNRRQDKERAENLSEKIRQFFPELSAYTHFVCPRWTCRVGDFEKPEQASRYVSLILRSKISVEARVIKCMVWLPKK